MLGADAAKKPRGRPRKHSSDAERVKAYRASRALRKVTVDVPSRYVRQLRHFAALLRESDIVENTFDWKDRPKGKKEHRYLTKDRRYELYGSICPGDEYGRSCRWTVKNEGFRIANGCTGNQTHAAFCIAFIESLFADEGREWSSKSEQLKIDHAEWVREMEKVAGSG